MPRPKCLRAAPALLAAAALLGTAPTAPAQESGREAQPPAAQPRTRVGVEEITVTARRREENLQESPVSIQAFGEQDLREHQVRMLTDISDQVPNLHLTQGSNPSYTRITIRGIGNSDPIVTRDPAVGVYIDGIYMARAISSMFAVSDIERIEVLRGPQGTLYGRNTVGGAINVITAKPNDEFGAKASLRYGNYNSLETNAHVNIPLNDEWAFMRVSFASMSRDPLKENKASSATLRLPSQGGQFPNFEDAEDRRMMGARVALRLLPAEDLELMFVGMQTRMHQRGRGAHCDYDATSEAATGLTAGGRPFSSLTTGTLAFFPLPDGGMNRVADYRTRCEGTEDLDFDEFISNVAGRSNVDTWGASFTATWDATEDIQLKWINGWNRYEFDGEQEFDWTDRAEFGHCYYDKERHDQLQTELNVNGDSLDNRLHWTGGLYWFWEKNLPNDGTLCRVGETLGQDWAANGYPGIDITDGMGNVLVGAGAVLPPGFFWDSNAVASFIETNHIKNYSYAAYAQATYDVTERLSITGGVRRMHEAKRWRILRERPAANAFFDANEANVPCVPFGPGSVGCTLLELSETERFDRWTMLSNVQFQWTDDFMTFATFSTGYKSGGFNGRADTANSLQRFDPEKVRSYELGLKSRWFDNRYIVNVGVFYTEYEDIQQTVLASSNDGSFSSVVRNSGEAILRGAEIELRGQPAAGLDLTAHFGWVDPDYHENLTFNNDQQLVNRRGDPFFNTPEFTMTLGASYSVDIGAGVLTPRVTWYHQGEVDFDTDTDNLVQGTRGVLSARIGFEFGDGMTEIALWGTNLLEREYVDEGIPFYDGFAVGDVFYGPPRLYGIEINRRF